MAWIYLRRSDFTSKWYVGRTHHKNYHMRKSGERGKFATDTSGKEVAIQVPDEEAHYQESEAIQFVASFVGSIHMANSQQMYQPVTGWKWRD